METKGIMSVTEATEKAFSSMQTIFNLNDITNHVRRILSPYRPESTTISAKMRKPRSKNKINYKSNEIGIYTKLS